MTAPAGNTSIWLRGLLDVCLLAVLERDPLYGYEMTKRLADSGLDGVAPGSIYPALARLETDGLIESFQQASAEGPTRKYFRVTTSGVGSLKARRSQWADFSSAINRVLSEGKP